MWLYRCEWSRGEIRDVDVFVPTCLSVKVLSRSGHRASKNRKPSSFFSFKRPLRFKGQHHKQFIAKEATWVKYLSVPTKV